MRIGSRLHPTLEVDYTPMIDMTFQLIAFFMILINFDAAENSDKIQLPVSILAKPPEAPAEVAITVQMDEKGRPIMAGQTYPSPADIRPILDLERETLEQRGQSAAIATIIIRGHKDAKTGVIQELIKVCQEARFEKFTLRAQEDLQARP
ncbi:MAG TPA: biopolymer transporter ExbD [Pirellulaceae bacterium]|nr:biopolymer transporter ExbD [Pirellulaceae bacterium]